MSITNYDGRLEAMAGYCESMYELLAKTNNAYYDSVETVYSKSLPSKYVDVMGIKMIGGKTVAWNQLVDTGTESVDTISGHKYYTLINGTASIVTSTGSAITVADDTADMVCDLTAMFGGGKEPASASDFSAVFPATHYDYSVPTLLSAGVTSVVSKDSDDATINTYPVPADVQTLDGYGWSAGTAYNYVDFEAKKFVKNVGKFVSSSDSSYVVNAVGTASTGIKIYLPANCKYFHYSTVGNFIDDTGYTHMNGYASSHENDYVNSLSSGIALNGGSEGVGGAYVTVFEPASYNITDATSAKTYFTANPITVYYELQTPIETDISDLLTDIIPEAEKSGTLTFENQHGDDYRIPVPVELEYIGV